MAGKGSPYTHLPFFYSDLFALGYEAVGELDPRLETEKPLERAVPRGRGLLSEGRKVRGVLLWNTWGRVDDARSIIGTAKRLE